MSIPKDAERRRIFLMRHGSVTYFDEEGRPIRPDTVPLNKAGREQATAAGKLFAGAGIRFDRVVVSGLRRTVETAERVLAETAEPEGSRVRIEINEALREVEGGKLAEIPDAELRDAFTGALDGSVSEDKRFLGGESIGALLDRVIPEIDALRADPSWDIVLLVLHGGVNRALISYLLTGERKFFGAVAQSPACINAIDVGERKTDVALRMMNHAPLDPLQTSTRKTTMEALYDQYLKFRSRGMPNVQ
jgi:broad specificity phosphatase PhoE